MQKATNIMLGISMFLSFDAIIVELETVQELQMLCSLRKQIVAQYAYARMETTYQTGCHS